MRAVESDSIVFFSQARIHPVFAESVHGQQDMVLDTGSIHTWIWEHEHLDRLGLGELGGIPSSVAAVAVPEKYETTFIAYADRDFYFCTRWIRSRFLIGAKEWSQPVCLVSKSRTRFPPWHAGFVGTNIGSGFAKSVGVVGIEPTDIGRSTGRVFFNDLLASQCHIGEQARLPVVTGSEFWTVDSTVSFGAYEVHAPLLLDTGGSFIFLPNKVYNAFINQIHALGIKLSSYSDLSLNPGKIDCSLIQSLPVLVARFTGTEYVLKITPIMYTLNNSEGVDCSVRIAPGGNAVKDFVLLGTDFFKHFAVSFNLNELAVRFCIPAAQYNEATYGLVYYPSQHGYVTLFVFMIGLIAVVMGRIL